MKAIKHALTERYYAFEDARRVAVDDPEVDLDAEPGTQAFRQIYADVSFAISTCRYEDANRVTGRRT